MADDTESKGVDFEAHRATWIGFTKLMIWSTIGTVAVLVLMAIFLL